MIENQAFALSGDGGQYYWVGATKTGEKDHWIWVSTGQSVKAKEWKGGELEGEHRCLTSGNSLHLVFVRTPFFPPTLDVLNCLFFCKQFISHRMDEELLGFKQNATINILLSANTNLKKPSGSQRKSR